MAIVTAPRVLLKWHSVVMEDELQQARRALGREQDAIEQRHLELRQKNIRTLEMYVSRHGPNGTPPRLREQRASDVTRDIQICAERDVIAVCLAPSALADPMVLRESLKAARDIVGNAILWEAQLKTYLRAKNKAIGWRLVQLDRYLGPDPGLVATWGRSSDPPLGSAYEAALNQAPHGYRIVEPGAPPKDPEFAPDALREAYERWMVRHAKLWLPQKLKVHALTRPRQLTKDGPATVVFLWRLRPLAIHALTRNSYALWELNDLRRRARSLHATPPKQRETCRPEIYGLMWSMVCAEICDVLASAEVERLVCGRADGERRAA